MLPKAKFGVDGFELRDYPLLRRDPPDDEWSGGELPTEVGETQEREGFRLSLATASSKPSTNLSRKTGLSTFTGKKKFVGVESQRVRSGESPPPGTT